MPSSCGARCESLPVDSLPLHPSKRGAPFRTGMARCIWLAASAQASGPASSSTAGLPPAVTPVLLGLFVSVIYIAQHLRTQFVFRKLGELFVETLSFLEHLLHCLDDLVLLEQPPKRARGAPSGDGNSARAFARRPAIPGRPAYHHRPVRGPDWRPQAALPPLDSSRDPC